MSNSPLLFLKQILIYVPQNWRQLLYVVYEVVYFSYVR
jgi:hypothetical protein